MKVLIVDDHALFRVGLQGLLERRGLQVVGAAAEGEEGLRLAETLNPDVVLLDLRGTELGDKGAEQLALGLQSGTPGILNLNIDGTGIGDKGMVALMEQLIKTKTVRMILLSNNPIDAEGAKAVAKFIDAKTPLDTVYLKAPPQMGEEARAALREAAKRQKDRVNFYDVKRESIQKNRAHDEL